MIFEYAKKASEWIQSFGIVSKNKAVVWPIKIYEIDGIGLSWFTYETKTVVGHMYKPKVGEGFSAKMESGKIGIFRIIKVRNCLDPSNMWFCDVEGVDYLENKP